MELSPSQLEALARAVAHTCDGELDCEEFLDRVAGYLESLPSGASGSALFGAVRAHLDLCPECREEFEALLRVFGQGEIA